MLQKPQQAVATVAVTAVAHGARPKVLGLVFPLNTEAGCCSCSLCATGLQGSCLGANCITTMLCKAQAQRGELAVNLPRQRCRLTACFNTAVGAEHAGVLLLLSTALCAWHRRLPRRRPTTAAPKPEDVLPCAAPDTAAAAAAAAAAPLPESPDVGASSYVEPTQSVSR